MGTEYRLTPAMSSRKLQVVSFVQQYIGRWGAWPSYGEIARAMDIKPSTARDAVRRAVRDKLLFRERGSRKPVVPAPDGVTHVAPGDVAAMLQLLRDAGVIVMDAGTDVDAHTFCPLPISPPFRHLPEIE